jgi:hypothetical protein
MSNDEAFDALSKFFDEWYETSKLLKAESEKTDDLVAAANMRAKRRASTRRHWIWWSSSASWRTSCSRRWARTSAMLGSHPLMVFERRRS